MLTLLIASGCAPGAGMVRHKMDPTTSVTISYSQSPLVFYRNVAGRAAYARDYLHVAPLEVNRAGSYRYFLWLGIWNTMEDAGAEATRDGFESIVIFADDEPLPLELSGWSVAAIGASEPIYIKPVASAADAYYQVTLDQLRLIAEAKDLRLQTAGSQRRSYEPWDDQRLARESLNEFLGSSIY